MTSKNKGKRVVSTTRRMALTASARIRFLIKMVLGLVFLAWSLGNFYLGMDSLAWQRTKPNLESTNPVSYSYVVNGVRYQGKTISYGDSIFYSSQTEFASIISSGNQLSVYFNPDMPGLSCLVPGFNKLGVYIPLSLGLFLVTIAGLELRARYLIR